MNLRTDERRTVIQIIATIAALGCCPLMTIDVYCTKLANMEM